MSILLISVLSREEKAVGMIINKIINFFKTLVNGGDNGVHSHSQNSELYKNSVFYDENKIEEVGDKFELQPDTVSEDAGVGRRPVEERYLNSSNWRIKRSLSWNHRSVHTSNGEFATWSTVYGIFSSV